MEPTLGLGVTCRKINDPSLTPLDPEKPPENKKILKFGVGGGWAEAFGLPSVGDSAAPLAASLDQPTQNA